MTGAFKRSATRSAVASGHAIRWGWKVGPALTGMAGISVGTGGLVQVFATHGGLWAGLVVAGVFAIAIDLKG